MSLVFTSVSAETRDAGVKLCVYGPAGAGKTVLTATMPNPVLISAESGTLSLRKENLERLYGANNPSICYDVPLIVIRTYEDLMDAYRWVTGSQEAAGFASICLDSISEIGEQVLNSAKKNVKDPRQAYGKLSDDMMALVRSFRDIRGKNIYMSAKQERFEDTVTGNTLYACALPGKKLGQALPYFFDEAFAMRDIRNPDGTCFRALQTFRDYQYDAKDRSGRLDPLEYPHLGAIIQKISA